MIHGSKPYKTPSLVHGPSVVHWASIKPTTLVDYTASLVHRAASVIHGPSIKGASLIHESASLVQTISSRIHGPSSLIYEASTLIHRRSSPLMHGHSIEGFSWIN
jgi:hypothetical protein